MMHVLIVISIALYKCFNEGYRILVSHAAIERKVKISLSFIGISYQITAHHFGERRSASTKKRWLLQIQWLLVFQHDRGIREKKLEFLVVRACR